MDALNVQVKQTNFARLYNGFDRTQTGAIVIALVLTVLDELALPNEELKFWKQRENS